MLKDIDFYGAWALLASLPLIMALLAPETVRGKIIASLCVLAVTFGLTVLMYSEAQSSNDRWNNGYCECGGQYQFSSATHWRTSKDYYYTCDKCGHTEEFSKIMK